MFYLARLFNGNNFVASERAVLYSVLFYFENANYTNRNQFHIRFVHRIWNTLKKCVNIYVVFSARTASNVIWSFHQTLHTSILSRQTLILQLMDHKRCIWTFHHHNCFVWTFHVSILHWQTLFLLLILLLMDHNWASEWAVPENYTFQERLAITSVTILTVILANITRLFILLVLNVICYSYSL